MPVTHLRADDLILPTPVFEEPGLKAARRRIVQALRRYAAMPFEELAANDHAGVRALLLAAAEALDRDGRPPEHCRCADRVRQHPRRRGGGPQVQ